jgi:hypothetical protein
MMQLFVERKIQILVATATLAWGINVPAHLVIVKGTEYYDGKTHKYIDFPVTGEQTIDMPVFILNSFSHDSAVRCPPNDWPCRPSPIRHVGGSLRFCAGHQEEFLQAIPVRAIPRGIQVKQYQQ